MTTEVSVKKDENDAQLVSVIQSRKTKSENTMKPIEFVEFDLSNGLHCIVHENHDTPIVALNLWYHVGSKNEHPERTGFAHLFEHLMFQGSRHVGKTEHFSYIQKAGGNLNGTTNEDRTNYFETLPASELNLGLWLESDRMMSLDVSAENFENQRQVVKEERRLRYDNAPYGTVYEHLHKHAYFKHPYRWTTIGSMEHLDNATLDDVQNFYKTFYAPNNATLVIAGDVNPDKAREAVEKYFGEIPRGASFERPIDDDLPLADEIRQTVYDNVQLGGVFMAYRICNVKSPDADTLGLISRVLSDGRSSRIYKTLVHEKRLAQSVNIFSAPAEHQGLFFVNLIAAQGVSLDALEKAFDEELHKLITSGVSEEELQKVKNANEVALLRGLSTVMSMADNLAYFHTFFGNAGEINQELQKAERVTTNEIQRVAERYFTSGRVVLHWLPK